LNQNSSSISRLRAYWQEQPLQPGLNGITSTSVFFQPLRAGTHNGKLVKRRTSAGAFHISTLRLKPCVGVRTTYSGREKREKTADWNSLDDILASPKGPKNEREKYFHGKKISVAHGVLYVTEAFEMSLYMCFVTVSQNCEIKYFWVTTATNY
jgi:hypothetical protein